MKAWELWDQATHQQRHGFLIHIGQSVNFKYNMFEGLPNALRVDIVCYFPEWIIH